MASTEQDECQHLLLDKEWERQQIRTFTAWINFQLKRAGLSIKDISTDLMDGKILTRLLEIISGESLPPTEKKNQCVHQINNLNRCLKFIEQKGVKLAGIGSEEIVDGNLKMTLGCVWVIILRFAIHSAAELKQNNGLLLWVKKKTQGYRGVDVTNFSSSFANGLAFNALIHRHRPDLFDYDKLNQNDPDTNLDHAFSVAEKELGIPRMLDVQDTKMSPDSKSIMTYVASMYHEFSKNQTVDNAAKRIGRVLDTNAENAKKIQEYEKIVSDLLKWINEKIDDFKDFGPEDQTLQALLDRANGVNKYRKTEKPPRAKEKAKLENLINSIKTRMILQKRPEFVPLEGHSIRDVEEAWKKLNHHEKVLLDRLYWLIQQLYFLDHLMRKFFTKCDQQDSWMKGKHDPIRVDISRMALVELSANKNKLIELLNDIETRRNRLKIVTSLRDRLQELNCREMDKVQKRYGEIFASFEDLKKEADEFGARLREREQLLLELDKLKLEYAKKASELKAFFDEAQEDLSDTYHVQSVSEIEAMQAELKAFLDSIPVCEKKLSEAIELEEKIKRSVDPRNLYCVVTGVELRGKFDEIQQMARARESMLSTEQRTQVDNDSLRQEFATLADHIEKFKHGIFGKIERAHDSAATLEAHVDLLKKVAEEVDSFYRDKIPKLEDLSKRMQERKVFHNPLTPHTFESISSDYQNMFDLIASSINEVENQIVVRDSSNLTEQQVKDARKSFDYIDKDRFNFLTYELFKDFLVSLEFDVAKDTPECAVELQRIITKCDPDKTGRITFGNFLNFMAMESKSTDTLDEIIESFKILSGGKDYITPDLIRKNIHDKAEEIISKMSPSHDPDAPPGALDYRSFAAALYGESDL
ncbi:Alpha-actinin-1 [Thelohanellus kitauei]|uniref:Alpha-actinin-1 n=1 Tax=Thelohanellus kitauei TaxID=669202 RepID=A0A0C2J996_THEKT|nr:Alpha-actinin-1 [Thelohanellus kitauei]